jgi:hypothetical protein
MATNWGGDGEWQNEITPLCYHGASRYGEKYSAERTQARREGVTAHRVM